jgi:hypothetical protein
MDIISSSYHQRYQEAHLAYKSQGSDLKNASFVLTPYLEQYKKLNNNIMRKSETCNILMRVYRYDYTNYITKKIYLS